MTEPLPKVIKQFSFLTQLSIKFVWQINLKIPTISTFFLLNSAEHEIYMYHADEY